MSPAKDVVKDGVWQVPIAERPKGWANLPVREPDNIVVHPQVLPPEVKVVGEQHVIEHSVETTQTRVERVTVQQKAAEPKKHKRVDLVKVEELKAKGLTNEKIGKKLGLSESAVQRAWITQKGKVVENKPKVKALTSSIRQSSEAVSSELIEHALKMYGPYADLDENDFDNITEFSYRLVADREASMQADHMIDCLMDELSKEDRLTEVALNKVWGYMYEMLKEKRRLEFELADCSDTIRTLGDTHRADAIEELLPEEDRKRLREKREKEKTGYAESSVEFQNLDA